MQNKVKSDQFIILLTYFQKDKNLMRKDDLHAMHSGLLHCVSEKSSHP